MAGPFENVSYFRVRLRVTIAMTALFGVLLIPSVQIFHDYYDTVLMWVDVLGLLAVLTFLTVGMPLWMRDPVTFSYGEKGIEVVLSSSISRRPRAIAWENVIDVRRDQISPDMFEVVYSPTRVNPRRVVTKDKEVFYFAPVEKVLIVSRQQLSEMKPHLPSHLWDKAPK
jgi:hypothetical protein